MTGIVLKIITSLVKKNVSKSFRDGRAHENLVFLYPNPFVIHFNGCAMKISAWLDVHLGRYLKKRLAQPKLRYNEFTNFVGNFVILILWMNKDTIEQSPVHGLFSDIIIPIRKLDTYSMGLFSNLQILYSNRLCRIWLQ